MHALKRIHRYLRAGGVLLDVHPQPTNSQIEVWQEDAIHHLGQIDQREDHQEIEEARLRLESLEERGLFVTERRGFFELLEHHPTVESWQDRWAQEGYRLVAEPELLETAQDLLTANGGELVIREQVRASRLRRVDTANKPSGDSGQSDAREA